MRRRGEAEGVRAVGAEIQRMDRGISVGIAFVVPDHVDPEKRIRGIGGQDRAQEVLLTIIYNKYSNHGGGEVYFL